MFIYDDKTIYLFSDTMCPLGKETLYPIVHEFERGWLLLDRAGALTTAMCIVEEMLKTRTLENKAVQSTLHIIDCQSTFIYVPRRIDLPIYRIIGGRAENTSVSIANPGIGVLPTEHGEYTDEMMGALAYHKGNIPKTLKGINGKMGFTLLPGIAYRMSVKSNQRVLKHIRNYN